LPDGTSAGERRRHTGYDRHARRRATGRGGLLVSAVQLTLPLAAAHALLDEDVFARGSSVGLDDSDLEFEDSNSAAETRIRCSVSLARFLLTELRRISARSQDDVELSFALTQAAIIVRRSIATQDGRCSTAE
jgi:hypothetical protein